jgi:hypothetical protein
MALGINPKEGIEVVLNLIYANADINRGTDLVLGCYTNTTVTVNTIWTDITQPNTGTGYLEKTLADDSWIIDNPNGEATYANQEWTATGSWSADVYGFYIRTTGATPKILHLQPSEIAPVTVTNGQVLTAILVESSV